MTALAYRRVLLVRLTSLGDVVRATGIAGAQRWALPKVEIVAVTDRALVGGIRRGAWDRSPPHRRRRPATVQRLAGCAQAIAAIAQGRRIRSGGRSAGNAGERCLGLCQRRRADGRPWPKRSLLDFLRLHKARSLFVAGELIRVSNKFTQEAIRFAKGPVVSR
jgi:hypothetical protein